MKRGSKLSSLLLAIFMVSSIFLGGCATKDKSVSINKNAEHSNAAKELKVHYINVGQGDSILIQQGDKSMLIDAGNNGDSELVKSYIEKQGVTTLDYVIGTHLHEDHIGGLDYVINSFKIGNIFMPKKTATTKTLESILNAVKNKGLTIKQPQVNESFQLGNAKFTVLAPKQIYDNENDCSIVIKLTYEKNSFLFTGDAEGTSEMDMIKGRLDLKADVLKVGYHGSKTSTAANFLRKVNPKYAVISVGKNNKYRHPNQGVMNTLKYKDIKVYRTDENGTVVAISNGKDIKFNCNPGSYTGYTIKANNSSKQQDRNDTTVVIPTISKKDTLENKSEETKPTPKAMVWVSKSSDKYHSKPKCRNMKPKKAKKISLKNAKKQKYTRCRKCFK
ncbi:ComEC/Rec2 family competence protein [Hathewaya histolytica]|uniref:Metallo beta-lactamase family protein n=1 Tax=Hathewaya histolytica TaxID=1498 RepID=A0A4V6Z1B2_HATHI|nr:ComEC/Rec2 family competence protein [Hathewaya histolytica]VTQ90527.1 metallo beta-lactamase family protein [Hathewaya histolytica]